MSPFEKNMDRPSLQGLLSGWHREFCEIAEPFDAPQSFWRFLSGRLVETDVVQDKAVIRKRSGDTYISVRVTGRQLGRIMYEGVDASSMGLALVSEFHADDREKLAKALDDLEGSSQ